MKTATTAPIFIVGTPRSGTTLVARILGKHPNIFMPGETHFFFDIHAKRKQYGDLASDIVARKAVTERLLSIYRRYNEPNDQLRVDRMTDTTDFAEQLINACRSYEEIFSKFMQLQMLSEGKRRWGNNAPKDIFYIDEILTFYPDAKIIVCARDIRDFLDSYKNKWKATVSDQEQRIKKLYHPIVTSLLWKASMRTVLSIQIKVAKDNIMLIPYEKLVTETEYTVKKLCDMINEKYQPDMLNIDFSNSSDKKNQSGVYASSVGKWVQRLSPEEAWLAQKIAKREMQQWGYQAEKLKINPVKLTGLLLSMPFSMRRALLANKQNTGPVLPYLTRRISSLMSRS